MTDNRMIKLLPCPFCGSGWLYETWRNGYCDETPTMFCNSCKAVVTWEQVEEEGVNDETQAFVREHWNSRAERTCRVIKSEFDGMMYVFRHEFSCDCGQRNLFTSESNPPKYCPNCGARVVG